VTRSDEIIQTLLTEEPLGLDDPYALYDELRESTPVHFGDHGIWVVSSYDEINTVLRHPGTGLSEGLRSNPDFDQSETFQTLASTMLFADDKAAHSRLRRLVRHNFTLQAAQSSRALVQEIVDRHLAKIDPTAEFDFMGDFAEHIPVEVVCALLGVPSEDYHLFKEWNFLIASASAASLPPGRLALIDEATVSLKAYLNDLLEQREREPQDDLLTALIQARDEDQRLSRDEAMAMAFLLLVAGSDTTSAFLCHAIIALARNPREWAWLIEHRDQLPSAIEELLRFDAPVHFGIMRYTTSPIELPDTVIPAHSRVWTILASGNRDPKRFADPNRLDLRREDIRHLAFAGGMHMCMGAMLARLEAEVMLGAVVDTFASLDLSGESIPWRNNGNLRTVDELRVVGVRR